MIMLGGRKEGETHFGSVGERETSRSRMGRPREEKGKEQVAQLGNFTRRAVPRVNVRPYDFGSRKAREGEEENDNYAVGSLLSLHQSRGRAFPGFPRFPRVTRS